VTAVATRWAERAGWEIVTVATRPDGVVVRAYGPLPGPDPDELRDLLDAEGLADVAVRLQLVPEERVELEPRE
jgi:hypothetical protein